MKTLVGFLLPPNMATSAWKGKKRPPEETGRAGAFTGGSERPVAQPTPVDWFWNKLPVHLKGFKGRALARSETGSSTQGVEGKDIPKTSSVSLCVPGDLAGKDRARIFPFRELWLSSHTCASGENLGTPW